jgi:hypothetical protein
MELSKKRVINHEETEKEAKKTTLNFDNLKLYGIDAFSEEEVFLMCTKRIREQENVEDDFLLYVCLELLKRGFYDKALLSYLSHFYCGATSDMKFVWDMAHRYGVATKNLAERIVTQMLFSETIFHEEEIFEDYYVGKPYFRLKQAYLAYASYQYILKNRVLHQNIFAIIMRELREGEYLADICKVAILRYFVDKEVDQNTAHVLQGYLRELCENRIVFGFYQNYPKEWLKEIQLYDKYIVEYHGKPDHKVMIVYQIQDAKKRTEVMVPMYEDTYIKEFTLYSGETLEYYFIEEADGKQLVSDKYVYTKERQTSCEGKYGRLNMMSEMPYEQRLEAMLQYKREEELAKEFFPIF